MDIALSFFGSVLNHNLMVSQNERESKESPNQYYIKRQREESHSHKKLEKIESGPEERSKSTIRQKQI